MHSQDDLAYFAQRAAIERELAAGAPPQAARVHEELARGYEVLAAGGPSMVRPTLSIVPDGRSASA